MIRRMIDFPTEIDPNLCFKVAETQDELEQAYSLLHDAYVGEKLMKPTPSGMRVTKYHLLPSTSTLIVKEGQTVIGTVSLVRQGAFGMPLEAIFDLKLPFGSRPAEVSALAIKNGVRQQRGRVLFPLLKFLYHYSVEYFGVTHFVIAVNPKWYDFYESILLFHRLATKTVSNYDFVNGAPAVGGYLELRQAYSGEYIPVYGKKSDERNIMKFFMDGDYSMMEFPLRKKSMISDPIWSPKLMEHFFHQKTQTIDQLNDFERSHLRELYDAPDYLSLIPEPNVTRIYERNSKRFETQLRSRFLLQDGSIVKAMIQDISATGLGGYSKFTLPQGPCTVLIDIEDLEPCRVSGEFQWQTLEGRFGFVVKEASSSWERYVHKLQARLILDSKTHHQPKKTGS
jgi:hypothetical protein